MFLDTKVSPFKDKGRKAQIDRYEDMYIDRQIDRQISI